MILPVRGATTTKSFLKKFFLYKKLYILTLYAASMFWLKIAQKTQKTDKNEMHFPLYFPIILSCETMIRSLRSFRWQ